MPVDRRPLPCMPYLSAMLEPNDHHCPDTYEDLCCVVLCDEITPL